MTLQERIENVQQATSLIKEAIGLISDAVQGTPEEGMTMTYTVGHLRSWIGQGNPYDHHTEKIIEGLEEWNDEKMRCDECGEEKPDEDFYDEGMCVKCYESHLEE